MKKLTVFTPAYNRADMLHTVYESLLSQTDSDFVWLVVDDGSSDDTWEVLNSFKREGKLEMELIRQENGGKMRAHNTGVKHAKTELFVCLDSDDRFTKNTVSDILKQWEKVSSDPRIAGIVAHKGRDEEHTLYDSVFPDVSEDTLSGLYRKGFSGETTLVYRTEVLMRYLFPEIPGEKYVPEDVVYDQIDREYRLSVLNRILTICVLTDEGLTDRAAELREKNPTGWYIYYVNRSRNTGLSLLKIKYISHYLRFYPVADRSIKRENKLPLLTSLIGIPGALILILMGKR
ncbi:MAG: glycosyltransferase family 2 protein [Lachnospiraceae bacterium]|nr:glycosyltransferase family 2 protein [Lachnospiraceae bacterium]